MLWAAIGLALAAPAPAQQKAVEPVGARAFAQWARDHASPLDCGSSAKGMEAVMAAIGDARVVALGEPTHGAHEPLALRNCLFRYLVEHGGFTAIALETGFSESRPLHDFAAGGSGDVRQLARDGFTWGFGGYAENIALLEWLHDHNAGLGADRKIGFYGIDLSGGDGAGLMPNTAIALRDALAYLSRTAPRRSLRTRQDIQPFLDRFTNDRYGSLAERERARMRAAIGRLIGFFERNRRALVAASSQNDYDWGLRNAVVARSIEDMFRVWPPHESGDRPSPDFYKPAAVRDAAMAANVRWVIERERRRNGKVLVFAHNAHIMNARLRGGIWSIYPQAPAVMGNHLRAALGRNLLIVPVSSVSDAPQGSGGGGRPGSLDAALAQVGLPHFLLDVRPARTMESIAPWLGKSQSMRANFTTEIEVVPQTAFDALIFFNRLTPAMPVRPAD